MTLEKRGNVMLGKFEIEAPLSNRERTEDLPQKRRQRHRSSESTNLNAPGERCSNNISIFIPGDSEIPEVLRAYWSKGNNAKET